MIQATSSIGRAQAATLGLAGTILRISQRLRDRIHGLGLTVSKACGMAETELESARKGDLGIGD